MEAILYGRVSTTAQTKEGRTGEARQTGDTEAYARANGYTIVKQVFDPGYSAWSNKHREKGGFGVLEREILAGDHQGRTLIVEHLDRLSRLDPETTWMLVRSIVQAGVSIITLNNGERYQANASLNMTQILILLVGSEQNHKQSEDKSDRLRKGYINRRDAARASGRPLTSLSPPWLTLGPDRKWIVNEERADVVREIFRLADEEKLGKLSIAKRLNDKKTGVKPWPIKRNDPTKQGAPKWHLSFITRILCNPAVIGEFQPMRRVDGERIPEGDVIRDYYPAIVDPAVFARVNAGAADRKAIRGRSSSEMRNLVSGLAVCASCNGKMVLKQTGRKGSVVNRGGGKTRILKQDNAALICSSFKSNHGCTNSKVIPYPRLERHLLADILTLSLDDSNFADGGEVRRLRTAIAEAQRQYGQASASAEAMWRAWAASETPMRMKLAEEAETKAKGFKEDAERLSGELLRAQGKVSSAEHLARVAAVRDTVHSDDPALRAKARVIVATSFRSIINAIVCDQHGVATGIIAGGAAGFELRGKDFKVASTLAVRDWHIATTKGGDKMADVHRRQQPDYIPGEARALVRAKVAATLKARAITASERESDAD